MGAAIAPDNPQVGALVMQTAMEWGMDDPLVLASLVSAESNFNPGTVGDGGMSYGLLQNHLRGRGSGHSPANLADPVYNLNISRDEIMRHYNAGKQKGLAGADLARYVGQYAQRPAAGNEQHYATHYNRLAPKLTNVGAAVNSQPVVTAVDRKGHMGEVSHNPQTQQSYVKWEGGANVEELDAPRQIGAKFLPVKNWAPRNLHQHNPANGPGAVDIAGNNIRLQAVESGYLIPVQNEWGTKLILQGDSGSSYLYHHLPSSIMQTVRPGLRVEGGDDLGTVAVQGDPAGHGPRWTGPHLHFGVAPPGNPYTPTNLHQYGSPVNAVDWLEALAAGGNLPASAPSNAPVWASGQPLIYQDPGVGAATQQYNVQLQPVSDLVMSGFGEYQDIMQFPGMPAAGSQSLFSPAYAPRSSWPTPPAGPREYQVGDSRSTVRDILSRVRQTART